MADSKKSGGIRLSEEEQKEVKIAASNGDCTTLEKYLKSGWDVNQRLNGIFRQTALHKAAGEGRTEVVRVLLQGGADVDVQDRRGVTPLHMAALHGHTDTVKVLLANKASVDVRGDVGLTPLYWAAWCGDTDTVKVLLANKASVDVRDEYGMTPLYEAARRGHTATVKLLLANKASVDVRDKRGNTPLHAASEGGHTEIVKLLCRERGCDVNTVNQNNKTALDVCGTFVLADKDEVKKTKTVLKKQMELQRDIKKLEKRHGHASEVRLRGARGATERASDQALGASAPPVEEQLGAVLEEFTKSKGKFIPDGEAEVNIKVKRRNDGLLDILGVNTRLSDYFPLIQPPSPPTASTTLFHDVNKKVMLAHLHESLARALPSVVLLARSDGYGLGSGFRVGPTYVMTNCHVVKELSVPLGSNAVLFHFNKALMQCMSSVQAAPILSVLACDEDLDVAIVDLDFNAALPAAFNLCQRLSHHSLPTPLTSFKVIVGQKYLHFAGHPDGQEKVLDTQCKIEHLSDMHRGKLLQLYTQSNNETYKTLADRRRVLYQSSSRFGPGSSGSPGFVADDQQEACLAVMHTSGHNIVLPQGQFHLNTVEQGARVECIYDFIYQHDANLCHRIFPGGRPK